jgi:hypothetical protein
VTDSNLDPPQTLAAAEQKFSSFLASQLYPATICWLNPGDMLVDRDRRFWIRDRRIKAAKRAALKYSEGLERNLGVELRAICATEAQTFASVFAPADDVEAQYHLMGHGLKLSCPTERCSTSTITNPIKWLVLWLRNGRSSKMLEL